MLLLFVQKICRINITIIMGEMFGQRRRGSQEMEKIKPFNQSKNLLAPNKKFSSLNFSVIGVEKV